jgi:predicted acyltransferase (DUF342 family)
MVDGGFPKMLVSKTARVIVAAGLAFLVALPACAGSVNKSIKIGDGEEAGGATSVNGSVTVGSDATVNGGVKTVNGKIRVDDRSSIRNATTVNGSIRLGDNVKAREITTVNGSISAGENCDIDGGIEAVNGSIELGKGSAVADNVENVNGRMLFSNNVIGGDVKTVNGDVELADASVIKGDLVVEKPSGWGNKNKKRRKPRIIVGPGSRVAGDIELEQEVDLFISETAEVGGVKGVMSMTDAVRFTGDKP